MTPRISATLSSEQAQAVHAAVRNACTILTGGPGTGKSTTIRALVDTFRSTRLRLVAPTGKAAARLEDATGLAASTIHRLLGAGPAGYKHTRHHPLPIDTLILDEGSMVDTQLLLDLLSAVPEGARMIIAGDPHQLPPINPGMPLHALIGTLPTTHLTRVYRQAQDSPIITLAYDIDAGEPLGEHHLPFHPVNDAITAAQIAVDAGAQLLAPTRKGPLGTEALNAAARTLHGRSGGLAITDGNATTGDPVVCIRNLYAQGVMNGTTGVVTAVTDEQGGCLTVDFDTHRVQFPASLRRALMPAYAITVHRAQGSEWPTVACVMHSTHGTMLTRTLAYTAVTRARTNLLLLGEVDAWNQAILHETPPRHCGLEERLHA